jgi:hypothetical protein
MASWFLTPTLNCTVITAMPGRDTEYVVHAGDARQHLLGRPATSASTSLAEAPGKATITSAIVTSIWGSSSFGVISVANTPSSISTRASRG